MNSIIRAEKGLQIRLAGYPVYYWFLLKDPDRLVLDIKNTTSRPLKVPKLTGLPVKNVRWNTREKNTLRLVFDLSPANFTGEIKVSRKSEGAQHYLDIRFSKQDIHQQKPGKTLPEKNRRIIVVIDPGHGGKDPGAIGYKHLREKDITLKIAKKTASLINDKAGFKAILTRARDNFVSLRGRTNIARENKADIFISIHANSLRTRRTRGAMIFVLSRRGANSEMGRWLEDRENNDSLIGGVDGIDLGDKSDLLAKVLLDLAMSHTAVHSLELAENMLKSFKSESIRLHSKKVEKAAFVVLKSPDIPSVLIETGFITTPSDARLLNSKVYQKKVAKSIVRAVTKYIIDNPPSGSLVAQEQEQHPVITRDYKVVKGDTLSNIANRFNVSVSSLLKANRLESANRLNVGQTLKVHGYFTYKVHTGDTLSDIANRFNIDPDTLARLNHLKDKSYLIKGENLKIPY